MAVAVVCVALLVAAPAVAETLPEAPVVNTLPAFQFVPLKAKKKRKPRQAVTKEVAADAVKREPLSRPATQVNEAAAVPAPPLAPAQTHPPAPPPPLRTTVPEEFEELLKANSTLVDVYYGGDFLLTVLAEYTADTIEFSDAASIVARIPNVIGKFALANHLSGQVPTNSALLCPAGSAPAACGKLEPAFIGVIFDESRFRAELFVHPDMLMTTPSTLSRYLPSLQADGGYSLVQNINAVASNSSAGDDSHAISGRTHVAKGMQRVYASWHNTDYQGFSVEELAWQRDTHEHEYMAGVFRARSDAMSFTRNNYLAGAGFGRSLKTRTDLEHLLGSEILLFLTSRSQVDIFRNGRLIDTSLHAAGNQLLDTSRLPSGAYDIEIRITDAGGSVRTQRRFFSKSNQLAPRGIPLYHLSGGLVVQPDHRETLPQNDGNWQIQGGYQTRRREDLGLSVAGSLTDTHALVEGGATWLQPLFQAGAQGMVSTQGDYGWLTHVFGRYDALSGTVSYRRTWPHFMPGETADYQLIEQQTSQQFASVSYPLFAGMLQANADVSRSATGDSELYSLRYLLPWATSRIQTANLTFEVANQDGDLFTQVGIELRNIGSHTNYGGSLYATQTRRDAGNDGSGTIGSADIGWRDDNLRPEDIEVQARVTVDENVDVLGLEGIHASRLGRAELGVEKIDGPLDGSVRTSATFDTNIVANRDGIDWGGYQLAPAALVLDIRGAAGHGIFDVLVNGYRVATARGGERNILPLAPYAKYRIQIVDRGTAFVAYDDRPREVTLYPGSVETLQWDVESVIVGAGRIILAENVCSHIDNVCYDVRTPLRSAIISGTSGFAMTDEDGRFQVEMTTGTTIIHARKRTIECDLTLEHIEMIGSIAKLGDLVCRPEVREKIPDDATQGRRPDNDPVDGKRIDQVER